MPELPYAMTAHLAAATGDAERLRECWAPDGVLELPYATPEMTGRIEGADDLVAFFGGAKRWGDWSFELRLDADDRIVAWREYWDKARV